MKKNGGFTLVEILAVVAILGFILVLVIPNMNISTNKTRQKAYETKIIMIEDAAILYGQDHYREIIEKSDANMAGYGKESTTNVIYRTYTLRVLDLVPEYLNKDADGTYLISDPRNAGTSLDNNKITIKINTNTKKVTAEFIE